MPWEVGKVLLQVQWVPKKLEEDAYDVQFELELEEEEENDELSESSTDDSYFQDPTSPTRQSRQARAKPLNARKMSTGLSTSKVGLSPLVIPYGPADGVWGMMKRVGGWRTEGWPSLWKGLLTSVTLSLAMSTIQPSVSSFLRPFFSANAPPLLVPLASHILTGIIVSPLDTLRTVQIIHPRPSPSPFTHFSLVSAHTSSNSIGETIRLLYTHPTLLYPAILDNTIRPLITLFMPRVIEHFTGVRVGVNIWMYPLLEFVGGVLSLGITLPIETIRRRLQAQVVLHGLPDPTSPQEEDRSSPRSPKTKDGRIPSCVHLSPRPYKGILDCFWRILTEERSGPPPKPHHRHDRIKAMRSPLTTPKPRGGAVRPSKQHKPRLSGGKRDVRNVFDADSPVGHRPRMLSEEMRASEYRAHTNAPSAHPQAGDGGLTEKLEDQYERAKADIEAQGIDGWLAGTGVGQLYRGFGMGVGALALVLVLGLITGDEPEGWAEL